MRPLVREAFSRTANGMGYRQVALALRNEHYRGRTFESFESFKAELEEYIAYWNTRRYQVGLKGMTPVQYRGHSIRAA